jgi:hypothetical protein
VPSLTPTQQQVGDRIEALIGLAAPALDLLLNVGERVSRIVGGGEDSEPLPVRPGERPPTQATGSFHGRA